MTEKKLKILRVWVLFLVVLNGFPIMGQKETKILQIRHTTSLPKIDGYINDDCWQGIQPVSGFYQFDPVNGVKATEETFVWATYDKKYIYFAFLMKDSQPGKIWAELTPRNLYENNDSITLILDTYNDKRTSIQFTVNPRGVQKNSVETIWKSEAIMRKDGWSAEIAIPFKSLRFSPRKKQIWGINISRYINRLNERDFWTNVNRNIPRLQQMGKLVGMEGIKPSYNLEFFPYSGIRSSKVNGEKENKIATGLDLKYCILPNLILDMTASPDFSEVESDPFIYQLSPYENYFQENRPFFTEGGQYFGQRPRRRGRQRPQFSLFYSRRIHSPKIAAKVTGKTDGCSFGLLGAFNKGDEEEEEEDGFFSVIRIQKDIFKNSQIGIYYAGKDETEDYNRNVGFDYNFNFKDIYYIRGQSFFSFNKNSENNGIGIHVLEFERNPDAGLRLELNFKRVEENVDVRTGFISRTDTQSTDLEVGYAWRFNNQLVKRVNPEIQVSIGHDSHGTITKKRAEIGGWVEFRSKLWMHFNLETGQSKYQLDDEEDNLYWSQDFINVYGGRCGFRWHRGGFLKSTDLWCRWHHRGIYNDEFTVVEAGSETNVDFSVTLRPKNNLEFSAGGEWTRQTIQRTGEAVFNGITYKTHLHYQMTRNLFLSSRLKGETNDNQYNFQLLVGYYFGAGNIIQLSYKKSNSLEDDIRERGYSITLKISYLLRI